MGDIPKYKTVKELEDKIQEYFDKGVAKKKILVGPPNNRKIEEIPVPTITGLCNYLGFASRQSFYDYEKRKKDFAYTIKRARTAIEQIYEEQLQTGNPTGAIFALKNFGWIDRMETDVTSGGKPIPLVPNYVRNNDSSPQDTETEKED